MLTSKVAKRYAQGLLSFTVEAGNTATVVAEMNDVAKTIENSKELRSLFHSPVIDFKKKGNICEEIFKNFSPVVQNLIQLVIKHNRESQLQNIAVEYINKVEDLQGVQRITLTTASEISPKNVEEILKSTSLVNFDKKYDLKQHIKTDLLGGYILRVGDQQVDASVKSKLSELKKEFQLN